MSKSNSKLTREQKEELKFFKIGYPEAKFYTVGRVTFAYVLQGKTMSVAWSIASLYEKKLRRKVGEFYAASRAVHQAMPIEYTKGEDIEYRLDLLAELITN